MLKVKKKTTRLRYKILRCKCFKLTMKGPEQRKLTKKKKMKKSEVLTFSLSKSKLMHSY